MSVSAAFARRVVALALLLAVGMAASAGAQPEGMQTFRATTTGAVSSVGAELRINVLRWTADEDRGAVLDLITPAPGEVAGGGGDEQERALQELQTVGFIWTGGSLGYALKYASRSAAEDGGERIVLLTDRPLGRWDRNGPWTGSGGSGPAAAAFTVVELRLDAEGRGEGKMSVDAAIRFDPPAGTVGLADYASAAVHLENVHREPPPYGSR